MYRLEYVMAIAQRDADYEGGPMAVLNLNRSQRRPPPYWDQPLYVVRRWDDRYTDSALLVARVEPES